MMRVFDTALPLLAGLALLVEGQGVNFSQVYSVKPSLKTVKQSTTSSTTVSTSSIASSIVSVLSSKHAATMIKSSAASSTGKTSSTSKSSSTSTKPTSSVRASSSTKTATSILTSTKKSSSSTTSSTSTKKSSTSTKKSISTSTIKSTTTTKKASTTTKASSTSTKKSSSTTKLLSSSSSSTKKASTTKKVKRAATSSSSLAAQCTNPNSISYGYVPSPNTPSQFLLDSFLSNLAAAQWLPPAGYSTSFQNAYGGLFANNYLGYYSLSSYNTSACAAYCDAKDSCNAFNIYFERTPTYIPDDSCPNPSAAASVTCALWGDLVTASQATNIGQYRKDFMVVIQGSNGYNFNPPPPSVSNYNGPNALDGGINVSKIGNTAVFLNSATFANFDVTQCSNKCAALSASNRQTAITNSASTYSPCNYFNVFNVTLSGQYQAMYCQLYTTSAVASYDTLTYGVDSGNTYNYTYSYGYALYPQDKGSVSNPWTPAPTGSNATCSALGTAGSSYIDYNQVNYTLGCGYDVQYSNDIGNSTAADFYSCFNLCDNFSGCNGFAYLGTTCYFKNLAGSSRTPQLNNYNVDMAWQPSAYAGFSASTIATTVTFATTTTAWTGATTTTVTQIVSGSGIVLIQTPGATPTGTVYVTTGVDSGTASTISSTTITPTAGGKTGTVKYFYPTPVTTCQNAGITWAGYTNIFSGKQSTTSYPAYKPESFKTIAPSWSGTATYIAETNAISASATVYNQRFTYNQLQILTLNHVFYVFAGRGTGYYSLTIPQTDDATFVWQGPTALSGYNRTNAALTSTSLVHQSITIAFFLTANTYTPFRVQWGNGAGGGDLEFNLFAPDGSVILASAGNSGTMSPDVVVFPCNSSLGAKPTAFGKET